MICGLPCSGIDTADYDHTVMFLPMRNVEGDVCNGRKTELGLATQSCLKGSPCRMWLYNAEVQLMLHELGHNCGLGHAQGVDTSIMLTSATTGRTGATYIHKPI